MCGINSPSRSGAAHGGLRTLRERGYPSAPRSASSCAEIKRGIRGRSEWPLLKPRHPSLGKSGMTHFHPIQQFAPVVPNAGFAPDCRRSWDRDRTAGVVKGFRTPASHWREGMRGGRRPKSLEGGNRGGSSHRRWCRSMGNLLPLLDLICRFRTGRRLSDQRGAGFGRPGGDRPGDLAFEAPGFAGRRRR